MRSILAVMLFGALAGPALASKSGEDEGRKSGAEVVAGCPMTYSAFEAAIPHIDIACPKGLSMGSATFCRASVANDAVHVYVFRNDDLQCLLQLKSYDEGSFDLVPH